MYFLHIFFFVAPSRVYYVSVIELIWRARVISVLFCKSIFLSLLHVICEHAVYTGIAQMFRCVRNLRGFAVGYAFFFFNLDDCASQMPTSW